MCILNFGVCSVFYFLAYEGMKGTTNPAVVDLSPYGFVFKELALQTLILNEFLSFLFFDILLQIILHTAEIILHNWFLRGVHPGIKTGDDFGICDSVTSRLLCVRLRRCSISCVYTMEPHLCSVHE